MAGYIGNDPAKSSVRIARQIYTTSGITTTFTFSSGYNAGYFDVYVNGSRQTEGKNFTASDGSNFDILNGGVGSGVTVEGVAYKAFNIASVSFEDISGTAGDLSVGGQITASTGDVGIATIHSSGIDVGVGIITAVFSGDGSSLSGVGVAGVSTTVHAGFNDITVAGISTFPDNAKAIFGTGNDLEVFSDGDNGVLKGLNGRIYQQSDTGLNFTKLGNTETFAIFTPDGSCDLYYDNSKKIETTNTGVTVTGNVGASGNVTAVDGTFTGEVSIGGTLTYEDVTNIDVVGLATFNGDVTFKGDTYDVLWDKSTDDLKFPDNASVKFGTGNDLSIYHNGTNSYISNDTGDLILGAGNGTSIKLQPEGGEDGLTVTHNGSVDLYYDNSKKLETTSGGITVTGNATATDFVNSDGDSVFAERDSWLFL